MTLTCPKCESDRIDTKNIARKTGGSVGTLAGATGGALGALSGAEIGGSVGTLGGPGGIVFGTIVGALIGGATGCVLGASLGEAIDQHVLDNCLCLRCGYTFSDRTPMASRQ